MHNITKELEKCKHPNSRKFSALVKRTLRKNNRQKSKRSHAVKQSLIGEKLMWVKDHLIPNIYTYSPDQVEEIINSYLLRFDEELKEIHSKYNSVNRNNNRQHANRKDVIRMILEREKDEFYTCGIEMPDLMNAAQLKTLREWDGDLKYLQNFKLRRFSVKYLAHEKQKSKSNSNEPKKDVNVQNSLNVMEVL